MVVTRGGLVGGDVIGLFLATAVTEFGSWSCKHCSAVHIGLGRWILISFRVAETELLTNLRRLIERPSVSYPSD